eukprot:CAMPEP_0195109950 /NCGR_PEP_ID=MMETSP0448-20130528/91032_1 /TAXON_ID=66468 /ORGANISM="Heterocapsa triquestra, Strain CCMP 448" /LENGTH=59 /DNA_ID=CAMNT_0040146611 /DNA_START=85 /DNA_END=264 /DNA_ORIENTATION=+
MTPVQPLSRAAWNSGLKLHNCTTAEAKTFPRRGLSLMRVVRKDERLSDQPAQMAAPYHA